MLVPGVEEVCQPVTEARCQLVQDRKCETQYLRKYEETCSHSQPEDQLCHQEQDCQYTDKEVCHTHYDTTQVGIISLSLALRVCLLNKGGSLLHSP